MSTYIADKQSIILQKISQFQQGSGDGKWLVFFQTVTENILLNSFSDGLIPIIIRFLRLFESAIQLPSSVCDVSDYFNLGEIVRIDFGRIEINMNNRFVSTGIPALWRVLCDVVTNSQNQITLLHRLQDIIFKAEPDAEKRLFISIGYSAFSHKGRYNGDVKTGCEFSKMFAGQLSDGPIACKDQRFLCRREQAHRLLYSFVIRSGTTYLFRRYRIQSGRYLHFCNIL